MTIHIRLPRRRSTRLISGAAILAVIAGLLVACGSAKDSFDQAFNGFAATMSTYKQDGTQIDEIHGASFHIAQDPEFNTTTDGKSNNDSQVLLISLANAHAHHVSSTLIMAEDGLTDITAQLPEQFRFENNKPGTPWLNNLRYNLTRYWNGTSMTIMVRSQDGTPIKVYGGNNVQVMSTSVPKSTWFRIKCPDGKTRSLFVYRADMTYIDNSLLATAK